MVCTSLSICLPIGKSIRDDLAAFYRPPGRALHGLKGGVHVGRVCAGGSDVSLPGRFGLLLGSLESGICARAAFKALCGLFGCGLVVCRLTPAAARRGLVWGLSVGVGRVRVVGAVADGKQSA